MKNYPDFYKKKKSLYRYTLSGDNEVILDNLTKEEVDSLGDANIGTYISNMQIYTPIFFASIFLVLISVAFLSDKSFTLPFTLPEVFRLNKW